VPVGWVRPDPNGKSVCVTYLGGTGEYEVLVQKESAKKTSPRTAWSKLSGKANDIGVGADGSAWVVSTKKARGGFQIYKLANNKWQNMKGSGLRITVGPKGNAWIATKDHSIYRHNGKVWKKFSGKANDIGVGADGTIWVVSTKKARGGFAIYQLLNRKWHFRNGSSLNIAIGPKGKAWVTTKDHSIFRSR